MNVIGIALLVLAAAETTQAPPGERNSLVYDYFQHAADATPPALAWNATSPAEHDAWRRAFEPKFLELLGRNPESVPLDVDWTAEKMETERYTRQKIYVRSEADYWVPVYYYFPRNITAKCPAMVCLHGHSGILPYIGEGTEKERAKSQEHELDYAVTFAESGCVVDAIVQRGWN